MAQPFICAATHAVARGGGGSSRARAVEGQAVLLDIRDSTRPVVCSSAVCAALVARFEGSGARGRLVGVNGGGLHIGQPRTP